MEQGAKLVKLIFKEGLGLQLVLWCIRLHLVVLLVLLDGSFRVQDFNIGFLYAT